MANIFDYDFTKEKILKKEKITKEKESNDEESLKINESIIPPFKEITKEEVIEKILNVNEKIENKISEKILEGINPNFNKDLKKQLDIFYNFVFNLNPKTKPYYEIVDGKMNISYNAFLDAREMLKNEYGIDPSEVRDLTNGTMNINYIYFEDGYSVNSNGIIKHYKQTVYDPEKEMDIDYFDFENSIFSIKPGVKISFVRVPGIKEFLIDNNPELSDDEKARLEKSVLKLDITTKDLEEQLNVNMKDVTKEVATLPFNDEYNETLKEGDATFNSCEWSGINYLYLTFLIMIGGGQVGKSPLPKSGEDSVYWKCPGESATVKTIHPWMYSESNPVGMPKSLLQTFCETFDKIFGANVDWDWSKKILGKRIGFHIKICIGGWLEYSIFKLQRWFSEKLSEFVCKEKETKITINPLGEGFDFDEEKEENIINLSDTVEEENNIFVKNLEEDL